VILVQHLVPWVQRSKHNDVAGFIYAVLGVAYAVLLGLMVFAVWQRWETADATATEEADELAEIFWLAHGLLESEGRHIQELARSSAREVVYEEWHLMARGEENSEAWAILDEMRGSIQALDPDTEAHKLLYDHELQSIHELADARQERLLQANAGLPAILWAVLLIGGVIVVTFTYLFGLQSTLVHTLMVAALALTIALVLFTEGALDYPFKGDIQVRPDAFLSVLKRFERCTLSDL
jgi:uncharacterized membrane protein YraQ (UPF0718 family)